MLVNQDGSYVEQLVYLGTRDGDTAFHDTGKWDIENNKLRATNPKGESTYFAQSEDGQSVTLLDLEGNPIETQMNYTLDQVKPSKKWDSTAIWLMPLSSQSVLVVVNTQLLASN